jgi:hypothetical protein
LEGAAAAYKKVLTLDPSNEAAKKELQRLESEVRKAPSGGAPSGGAGAGWSGGGFSSSSSSSTNTSKHGWISDSVLLLAQLFSVVHAIMVVFITNHYESKNAFGRSILASLFSFLGQAVFFYGLPTFGTIKLLWKAFRGKASQAELRGIANFAMDNNTHNIFYCSLTLSAAPSLCEC